MSHTYCMHAYMRTYAHAYVHTYIRTYVHTYIRTNIRTYIHTYMNTYIHTYINPCVHAHKHVYMNIHRERERWRCMCACILGERYTCVQRNSGNTPATSEMLDISRMLNRNRMSQRGLTGSKFPVAEVSGSKSHTLNGFLDQSP